MVADTTFYSRVSLSRHVRIQYCEDLFYVHPMTMIMNNEHQHDHKQEHDQLDHFFMSWLLLFLNFLVLSRFCNLQNHDSVIFSNPY